MSGNVIKEKSLFRKYHILKILFDEGGKALAELSYITKISLPLVTKLVMELRAEGYLVEEKDTSKNTQAGRPATLYNLNPVSGYIMGVDLGRVYTTFLLIDYRQNIVFEKREKKSYLFDDETVIKKVCNEISQIIKESGIDKSKFMGAGFSIPGIINSATGESESYLNFGKPIKDLFEEELKLPVIIEHDAKAMAYGEFWLGGAKSLQNVICVNYGWGLGLGMILNGNIYYGQNGYAGEFGHIPVVANGEQCYCGKRGCLETVSSGKSIERIAREKLAGGVPSILNNSGKNVAEIETSDILEAANSGDQFSIELLQEAGFYLGYGIATLINIMNPDKIILNGSISKVADYILDSVRSSAMKHSHVKLNNKVEFEISKLGHKAAALGAARLIANNVI